VLQSKSEIIEKCFTLCYILQNIFQQNVYFIIHQLSLNINTNKKRHNYINKNKNCAVLKHSLQTHFYLTHFTHLSFLASRAETILLSVEVELEEKLFECEAFSQLS